MKTVTIILSLIALGIAIVCFAWVLSENRTNKRAMAIIADAQPGASLVQLIEQYGEPDFVTNEIERMGSGGAPINQEFCEGKTLNQYYLTPPCTWVNIYTDKNGNIVFVNWSRS